MTEFGLQADDFDDDGSLNGIDPDADGDGKLAADLDPDDDADGLPDTYVFRPATCAGPSPAWRPPRCRSRSPARSRLTASSSSSPSTASPTPTPPRSRRLRRPRRPPRLVDYGPSTVAITPSPPPTSASPAPASSSSRTAPRPTRRVGQRAVPDPNGYASDAACARRRRQPHGPFNYDDASPRVTGEHRPPRLRRGRSRPRALGLDADLAHQPAQHPGPLGFLDIGLAGTVSLDPQVGLDLLDPGTAKADGRLSFVEVAR